MKQVYFRRQYLFKAKHNYTNSNYIWKISQWKNDEIYCLGFARVTGKLNYVLIKSNEGQQSLSSLTTVTGQ